MKHETPAAGSVVIIVTKLCDEWLNVLKRVSFRCKTEPSV
jgi:hypothetical protein